MALSFLKFVFSRAMVCYAVLFLLSGLVVDYKKIKFQAQIREINASMPESFEHLMDVYQGSTKPDVIMFKRYLVFYSRIAYYFPQRSDAWILMGYCLSVMGDKDGALMSFQKASKASPRIFGPYFNAGVIYFRSAQFAKAKEMFEKAVHSDKKATLQLINDSKVVFQSLLADAPDFAHTIEANLDAAFGRAYQLLVLSSYYSQNYQEMFNFAVEAAAVNPAEKFVYDFYAGMSQLKQGKYDSAVLYFSSALKARPDFDDAARYKEAALKKLGEISQTTSQKPSAPYNKDNLLPDNPAAFFKTVNLEIL